MDTMQHLGVVVYFWDLQEQNRLLTDCLDPLARESPEIEGRFWFTRLDTRGPHVSALFSHSSNEAELVASRAKDRIEAYLRRDPSRVTLSPEALEERHRACRGKAICSVDKRPGLGPNNSYQLFQHPDDGYPFGQCAAENLRHPWRTELWSLTTWSLDMLRVYTKRPPLAPAMSLLAAVDRQIRDLDGDAMSYWRHHAFTLLPALPGRLEENPEAVPRSLFGRLGSDWKRGFEAAFAKDRMEDPLPGNLSRWVQISLRCGERGGRPWAPLRESLHGVLAQLGVPVRRQIPLVLYAWLRNLYSGEDPLASPQRASIPHQESRS